MAELTYDYGCVHRSFGAKLFPVTPFGKWALRVVDPNNNVDLTDLSRVEIYFVGMAVKFNIHRPSVSGNQFDKSGEQDRSPACGGRGRLMK